MATYFVLEDCKSRGARRLVSINGRVREIDPMPIEEQELGRGPITRRRITTIKLAADLQGSRRYIASDDFTTELR